jgi:hypothetical protein
LNLKNNEGKKVFIKTKKEDVALDEIQFKRLSNFYDDVMIHLFYNRNDADRYVKYNGHVYDLAKPSERLAFKNIMDTEVFAKMKESYKGNEFTKGFTSDAKMNDLGEYEVYWKQKKSFENNDSMFASSAGFDMIKDDSMNKGDSTNEQLIRQYNLLVSKDAVSKKNFTKYFDFVTLQPFIDFQNQFNRIKDITDYMQRIGMVNNDLFKFLNNSLNDNETIEFMTKILISSKIKAQTYETQYDEATKKLTYKYNNNTFIPMYLGYTPETMTQIFNYKTPSILEIKQTQANNEREMIKYNLINGILNTITNC